MKRKRYMEKRIASFLQEHEASASAAGMSHPQVEPGDGTNHFHSISRGSRPNGHCRRLLVPMPPPTFPRVAVTL